MKILIATNNQGKLNEYKRLFDKFNLECICYKDLSLNVDPLETGLTFKANSKIKALEAKKYYEGIIISDDSGLKIKALPHILGINSARFLGEKTSYTKKNQEIISLMKNKKNRKAYFTTIITLLYKNKVKQFKGVLKGSIAFDLEGNEGFGYDPIFIPKGFNNTFATLGVNFKNEISHRAKALKKMERYLRKHYENIISK